MQKLNGMLHLKQDFLKKGVVIGAKGNHYDFVNFDIDQYGATLGDLVRGTAKISRYVGNTRGFYSVAQHSVLGARALLLHGEVDAAMQFLFHDLGEAVYGDFSGPIKRLMESSLEGHESFDIKKLMDAVDREICVKYGVKWPHDDQVHIVDKNLAQYELTNMMMFNNHGEYWDHDYAYQQWCATYKEVRTHQLIASGKAEYEINRIVEIEVDTIQ